MPMHPLSVCDDCILIFKVAASFLASEYVSRMEEHLLFDATYQSRLLDNVSLEKCPMCILLQACFGTKLQQTFNHHVEKQYFQLCKSTSGEVRITLLTTKEGIDSATDTYLRIMKDGDENLCSLDTRSTWSPETMMNIRSWMEDCMSSHEQCKVAPGTAQLPTRLIDVMPSSNPYQVSSLCDLSQKEQFVSLSLEKSPGVKIIPSSDLPTDTHYLTLSHRWGHPPGVLLTRKTLYLLDGDISSCLLEREDTTVFCHAVHVARALGFRYIWIDALCIMQDDSVEKTTEIMRMDEIYGSSSLNISAIEGSAANGICFDRDPRVINPCRATIKVWREREECLQAFSPTCFLRPAEGPLNKRGWVFQERELAPRICQFTKSQVYWECRCLLASEVLPRGGPRKAAAPKNKRVGIFTSASTSQLKQEWLDVVGEYSKTSLTFASDRLLAVSAVAKRYCAALELDPSDYLAGIWKADLPVALLWFQFSDDPTISTTPATGAVSILAPSWSWASLLVQVDLVISMDLEPQAAILGTWITRSSPNPFGGADSCRIRLRGPLCKCMRQVKDGVPWISTGKHTTFEETTWSWGDRITIKWDSSRDIVAKALNLNENDASSRLDCYLLLLSVSSDEEEDVNKLRGIILRRRSLRGTYDRIGAFWVSWEMTYEGSELDDAFNGRLDTLESDDYLEISSVGRYVIDLV